MGKRVIMEYGEGSIPHGIVHRHTGHELVICRSVSSIIAAENTTYRLSGDFAICNPAMTVHMQLNVPDSGYTRYFFQFPPDFLTDVLPEDNRPDHFAIFIIPPEDRRRLEPYLRLLLNTDGEPEDEGKHNRQRYLLALIWQELRRLSPAETENATTRRAAESRLVHDICLYIDRHYRENLTIDVLAACFFISRATLNRYFRQNFGTTVSHFIQYIRLEKAREYLRQGLSVKETSDLCGFSAPDYFNKVFRRHLGITPAQYKKMKNPEYRER